jgi:peptidyl-prolyl cis-trans isomerase SurA
MRVTLLLSAVLALGLAAPRAGAQGGDPFAPVVYVNNSAVTRFELTQRALFLQALNTPGDLEALARTALIENRLQVQEAERLEIELTQEQLDAGIAEFAGRANLTAEQFTAALAERGVEPQTLRDFIRAGLLWREVVRERYGPRVDITPNDVDRALAPTAVRGGVRLLLSEIIIPAPPDQAADARALAEELSATIRSEAEFSDAAQQFSASGSAPAGGRIDWLPAENLPPPIVELLLSLPPGGVSPPVQIPNAVAIFQLRAIEDTGRPAGLPVSVEYAQVLFPDTPEGLAQAVAMRNAADSCNDLYGLARDLPPDQLIVESGPVGSVPGDIGLQLARLDPGEATVDLRRGGARVLLMLCRRIVDRPAPEAAPGAEGEAAAPPTTAQIREQTGNLLFNQRIGQLSNAYLQDLVADAIIREP